MVGRSGAMLAPLTPLLVSVGTLMLWYGADQFFPVFSGILFHVAAIRIVRQHRHIGRIPHPLHTRNAEQKIARHNWRGEKAVINIQTYTTNWIEIQFYNFKF